MITLIWNSTSISLQHRRQARPAFSPKPPSAVSDTRNNHKFFSRNYGTLLDTKIHESKMIEGSPKNVDACRRAEPLTVGELPTISLDSPRRLIRLSEECDLPGLSNSCIPDTEAQTGGP